MNIEGLIIGFFIGLVIYILFISPDKVEVSFTSLDETKVYFKYQKELTYEHYSLFLQVGKRTLIDFNKKI